MTNCQGFEILAHRLWDTSLSWQPNHTKSDSWGYLICRAPDGAIYGAVGAVSSTAWTCATGYGIPLSLHEKFDIDPLSVLEQFALTCGLSITARAGLELGDGLVVAGMNALTVEVLAAGRAQGASTLCLLQHADNTQAHPEADSVIALDNAATFDEQFAAFIAGIAGKVVFVDTCGNVALIHAMTSQLKRFGRLLLCRPDVHTSTVLNIRDFQHRRSAVFDYWASAVTPEETTTLQRHFERAGRLIQWRQGTLKHLNGQSTGMLMEGV